MMDISVGAGNDIFNPNNISFAERELELKNKEERENSALKKQKNSPFSNFYQFNREHSKEMIWLATNHPKANAIILFLLDQMDHYNAVMCSSKVISEALGIGRTTVSTSIKILKEHGFITVYKSGTSNIYAVNKQLAWSSWGSNHKYAKFDARIIISENEQEKNKADVKIIKHKEITVIENKKDQ